MPLIDIQTNLKDLKYSDFGAEPPLITKSINNPPSRQNQMNLEVGARVDDLKRFTKLLKTPGGIKFLANQTALNTIENNIQNPDKTLAGKLISGGWNTAKQVASTLAQIPVNGTGTHFVEAFGGRSGYVKGVQGHSLAKSGAEIPITGNRTNIFGVEKKNSPIFESSEVTPTAKNTNSRILRKYLSKGRTTDSIFGIFNRKDSGQSSFESEMQKNLEEDRQGALYKKAFKVDNTDGEQQESNFYFQTKEGKILSESEFTDQLNFGSGVNTLAGNIDYTHNKEEGAFKVYDPITARLPVTGSVDDVADFIQDEGLNRYYNDIIDFNIKVVTPRPNPNDGPLITGLYFRAFLDSFDDKYTSKWGSQKYIGRAEELYNYEGFSRDISFGFKAVAMSQGELKPLYEKLNSLAGHLAPTYGALAGASGKFMKGNLVTVSIGDYIKNQPGFISSVSFSWSTDYTFNTRANENDFDKELPMILDVSVSFTPIHTFAPEFGQKFILDDSPVFNRPSDTEESEGGTEESNNNSSTIGEASPTY
jgi:hypothetical protein